MLESIPFPKEGSLSIGNYLPIYILSFLSKLFETHLPSGLKPPLYALSNLRPVVGHFLGEIIHHSLTVFVTWVLLLILCNEKLYGHYDKYYKFHVLKDNKSTKVCHRRTFHCITGPNTSTCLWSTSELHSFQGKAWAWVTSIHVLLLTWTLRCLEESFG